MNAWEAAWRAVGLGSDDILSATVSEVGRGKPSDYAWPSVSLKFSGIITDTLIVKHIVCCNPSRVRPSAQE